MSFCPASAVRRRSLPRDDDDFQHFRDMHRVSQRARDAFEVRLKAALFQMRRGTSQHRSNGDERRYENKIANPVVPDATGSTLVPYVGPSLTAGNEIDKLASNVAVGRAGPCGVHWRSDCDQGMFLGEACAIAALQDMRRTWKESFVGFRFKKFDGTMVTI